MNPDPEFIPAHMRARIAGFESANCLNCDHNQPTETENWCLKQMHDPFPGASLYHTVCELYAPNLRVVR